MGFPLKIRQFLNDTRMGKILFLGLPLMAGRLSHYFHQIADSMMMGHYREGSVDLAALAIAGTFIWIINTTLWPLGTGMQALISRKSGQADSEERDRQIGRILDNGLFTAVAVAVLAIGISFFARPVLNFFIKSDTLVELAMEYIRILRFSLLPFGIQVVVERFFSSLSKTRYTMTASLISNLLNILLNYIFIFGRFGAPEMGIRGAALGTALSYGAGCLYILIIAFKKEYRTRYHYFRFEKLDRGQIKNIIRISLPPGIQNIGAFAVIFLYEAMVENISIVSLAATHVVFAAFRINKTIVGGFSHGVSILVGNRLGADDKDDAEKLLKTGYGLGAVIGLLVFLTVFFFPETIARGFSSSPETLAVISTALRFFAPFFFLEILGFTFEMVFVNTGWGKFVLFSELFTNLIFILGFTFLFARVLNLGITAAWLGFGLYQVFHSLILHLGWKSGKWLHIDVERK